MSDVKAVDQPAATPSCRDPDVGRDQDPDLLSRFAVTRTRRRARTWGGVVGVAGAIAAMTLGGPLPFIGVGLLCGTWLLALSTYQAVRWGSRRRPADTPPDSAADRANVRPNEQAASAVSAVVSVHRMTVASFAWPLAAVCLLAPLTLHFLGFLVLLGSRLTDDALGGALGGFGAYMTLSSALLIPAYLTLLAESRRFARSLAGLTRKPVHDGFGTTVTVEAALAACVPGILFAGIPPLAVATTGVVFLPALFAMARSVFDAERTELLVLEHELITKHRDATFDALRSLLLDETTPFASRVAAYRFLVDHYDRDRLAPILDTVLERRPVDALTMRTLDACRAIVHRPTPSALVRLARAPVPELAQAAVSLLVRCHGVLAEPYLRGLLDAQTPHARRAVLQGLGKVGTRESIVAIRAAMQRLDGQLPTSSAIVAIERIQRRLPSAEPGQLSLVAASSGGELAISPEAGLALTSDDDR